MRRTRRDITGARLRIASRRTSPAVSGRCRAPTPSSVCTRPRCDTRGSCLDLCEAHGLEDWDLAYAYEAVARAYKTAGAGPEAAAYSKLAREVPVAEADDREQLEKDLATL